MRDPVPPTVLTDPATVVVITRADDGAVQIHEGGWPADVPVDGEPVVTADGVVAVMAGPEVCAVLGPFVDARSALLDRPDARRLLGAVAFGQWRVRSRYCPRCGTPLSPDGGGRALRCVDGHQEFPRLEPAVIMRVVDERDRILLARQDRWPAGRMSVLAGFVDPGESLEDAVGREVMEEVGVTVADITYVRSQPWPFPASLMLAFTAVAGSTRLTLQDEEIAEAAWFSRAELVGAMGSGAVSLPSPLSVAHHLIQTWLGAPLRTWDG